MVESSLLIAAIGVGGTLFAQIINGYNNRKRDQFSEEKKNFRSISEQIVEMKVNTIIDLYEQNKKISEGLETFAFLSRKDPTLSISKERYKEYINDKKEYDRLINEVKIFLSEEQQEVLTKASLTHTIIKKSIEENSNGNYVINWDKVESDNYIKQNNIDIEHTGLHSRMVAELLYNEINKPIEKLYDSDFRSNLTEEMQEYISEPSLTKYSDKELIEEAKNN